MVDTDRELRLADALHRIEGKLEEIEHLITGNDTPEKGLIVRIDRLEQTASATKARADRLSGSMFAIGVAVTISIVLGVLKLVSPNL